MEAIDELDLLFVMVPAGGNALTNALSSSNISTAPGQPALPSGDASVLIFDLQTLEQRMKLDQVRGATCFCVERSIEQVELKSVPPTSTAAKEYRNEPGNNKSLPKNIQAPTSDPIWTDDLISSSVQSIMTQSSLPMAGTTPTESSSSRSHSRDMSRASLEEDLKQMNPSSADYSPQLGQQSLKQQPATVPAMIIRLYIACRRRIMLLEWADAEYVRSRDLLYSNNPNDRILSMTWISDMSAQRSASKATLITPRSADRVRDARKGGRICCALASGKYLLVNPKRKRGSVKELFSAGGSVTEGVSNSGASQFAWPLVTKISNGDEAIVSKENMSVFIGADGKPTKSYGVQWSRVPISIVYDFPYLIATLWTPLTSSNNPEHLVSIEVRNLATQSLVQQFDLPRANLMISAAQSRGSLFIASDRQIWRLRAVDAKRQLQDLVDRHEYNDAIQLLEQLDSLPHDEKEVQIFKMKVSQAVWCFSGAGEYEIAMSILADLEADPSDVLLLFYPSMISASMKKLLAADTRVKQSETTIVTPAAAAPKATASPIAQFTTFLDSNTTIESTAVSTFTSDLLNSPQTTTQYLKLKRKLKLLKPMIDRPIDLSHVDEVKATRALVRYLTDMRAKLLKIKYDAEKAASGSSAASNGAQPNMSMDVDEFDESLVIIDTTLLKAYLLVSDSLVGPLLRVPNRVDLDEAESLLLEKNKSSELVDLYYAKGLHRKALLFLKRQFDSDPSKSDLNVFYIVGYLRKLTVEQFELILEFSEPLLRSHPHAAIQIFLDDDTDLDDSSAAALMHSSEFSLPELKQGESKFPRARVLTHLEKVSSDLALRYLECLVYRRGDRTPEFHNKLIMYYLERILTSEQLKRRNESGSGFVSSATEKTSGQLTMDQYRRKLASFLEQSRWYRPERMLSRFPVDGLFEERAILLSKLGQHEQALSIYIDKLEDFDLVEQYCDRIWSKRDSSDNSKSIYVTALKLYMKPSCPIDRDLVIDASLRLLSRYGDRIDPNQVLHLLPASTPLLKLLPFFAKFLSSTAQQHHQLELQRSLIKAYEVQLREQKMDLEQRRVVVTDFTVCPVCKKRIGGSSVFAVVKFGRERVGVGGMSGSFTTQFHPLEGQQLVHLTCRDALSSIKL